MKKRGILIGLALALTALISGCGDGSSDSSGTISMNITDAKPALPTTGVVESVTITFDEVSVHKSGGGWITLPVATQPQSYTIDLYQFSDGTKTQFVPPVSLSSGKYTQVRIGVTSGTISIDGKDYPLEIPSANLKTDKNFEFDVPDGGAVDLTVDFDLSQSIVVTGSGTYQLKPVVHLVTTAEAWTIKGNINSSSFGIPPDDQAFVVVYRDLPLIGTFDDGIDEVYTRLSVPKGASDPTEFSVYWLVPDENYYVEVYLGDPDSGGSLKYHKFINSTGLDSDTNWDPISKVYLLEGGANLF